MFSKLRDLVGFGACLLACVPSVQAQAAPFDPAIDAVQRAAVIDSVLARLDAHYVFPEVARAMREAIRAREAAGDYDGIGDVRILADSLKHHLQAVSHDGHLTVFASTRPLPPPDAGLPPGPEVERQAQWANYGIAQAMRLDGNVGYLRIATFEYFTPMAAEAVAQAMGLLARTDALIIDVRGNPGGEPRMVQLVCSYLFGDEPVHLNTIYTRPTDETEEFWTHAVAGPRYGPDRPVYVLTSAESFSAAEELAYDLQQRGRATIVGETTGGGAHPGDLEAATERVRIFIPNGRAINPVSGTDWEGTGVVPDLPTSEAHALSVAYRAALQHLLEQAADPERLSAYRTALETLAPLIPQQP